VVREHGRLQLIRLLGVLARSARTGTIFLATLASSRSRVLVGPDIADRINIFRSSDNGNSFQAPVNGSPGFVPGVDFQDKEWMAVDNNPGPGYGNVYLAWRDFSSNADNNGLLFARSTDDGLTWSQGTLLDGGGQGANIAVGPNHAVYVSYFNGFYAPSGKPELQIRMRTSTDFGATFGPVVFVAPLRNSNVNNGDLGLTDSSGRSFRSNAFPQAAVNPVTGDIYVVYDGQGNGKDRADVFLTESSDGGQKWSNPIRLNDDKTDNDQWQPALAVTPDGSHLGIFWYDRRLDPADNLIDRFGAIGSVSGQTVTFGSNFRITDVSFPPAFGQDPGVRAEFMGDYDQAVADNSFFYTTWGDNRLPNPNYPAHANQPDVRLAKIPVTGPADALTAAGAVTDNPGAQMLTQAARQPILILTEALARWGSIGVDISALHEMDVRTANLGGAMLGLASGRPLWLNNNAAGWGWFVDATPGGEHDEEGMMAETLHAGTRPEASRALDADTTWFACDLLFAVLGGR